MQDDTDLTYAGLLDPDAKRYWEAFAVTKTGRVLMLPVVYAPDDLVLSHMRRRWDAVTTGTSHIDSWRSSALVNAQSVVENALVLCPPTGAADTWTELPIADVGFPLRSMWLAERVAWHWTKRPCRSLGLVPGSLLVARTESDGIGCLLGEVPLPDPLEGLQDPTYSRYAGSRLFHYDVGVLSAIEEVEIGAEDRASHQDRVKRGRVKKSKVARVRVLTTADVQRLIPRQAMSLDLEHLRTDAGHDTVWQLDDVFALTLPLPVGAVPQEHSDGIFPAVVEEDWQHDDEVGPVRRGKYDSLASFMKDMKRTDSRSVRPVVDHGRVSHNCSGIGAASEVPLSESLRDVVSCANVKRFVRETVHHHTDHRSAGKRGGRTLTALSRTRVEQQPPPEIFQF